MRYWYSKNFMLVSNPLKKFQKTRAKKLSAKWSCYFFSCVLKFATFNFFWVNFCAFFDGFELSIEFCVL